MNKKGSVSKVIFFVVIASLAASALVCFWFASFAGPILSAIGVQDLFFNLQQDSWKASTSPLTPEQANGLCQNFDLSKETICNKQDVYGPEFYPYIVEAFHPTEFAKFGDNSKPADYEEVEKKLGQFKVVCRPSAAESNTIQLLLCFYDLHGDGVYTLRIFFKEPEKTVFRIVGPLNIDW